MRVISTRVATDSREALHEAGNYASQCAIQSMHRELGREIPLDSISIVKDALGKPYGGIYDEPALIPLAISHSFPFVFVATTLENVALGADVERIRDFAPATREAFLTPREKEYIGASPLAEQARLSTLAWSLKESVLKAHGVGLRIHPALIETTHTLMTEGGTQDVFEIDGVTHAAETYIWKVDTQFVATIVALLK